jgi:hypothetical protein
MGLLTLGIWTPYDAHGHGLTRLAADFKNFDGSESATTTGVFPASTGSVAGDDGSLVYSKTVFTQAPDQNVLYITISTVADTHEGAALWINCRVDGVDCNPGFGGAAGAPGGWIAVNKLPAADGGASNCNDGGGGAGDCDDNSVYYTWCKAIEHVDGGGSGLGGGSAHTVEIRMATSASGSTVFIEAAHFYVDSSDIEPENACVQAPGLNG